MRTVPVCPIRFAIVFQTFVVAFRECAELLLIASALLGAARAAGRFDLVARIAQGIALGLVLGLACAAGYLVLPESAWRDGLLMLAAGVVTLVAVSRVFASGRSVDREATAAFEDWMQAPLAPVLLAGFALFCTWREVVEATFLLRTAWSETDATAFATGLVGALVAAGACALAYRRLVLRAGMATVFRVSALLVAYLAAELVVDGLTKLVGGHAPALDAFLDDGPYRTWTLVLLVSVPALQWLTLAWRDTARVSASR